MWTFLKLTESQGTVNFCLSNIHQTVYDPVRIGNQAMAREAGRDSYECPKTREHRWVSLSLFVFISIAFLVFLIPRVRTH